MEQAARALGSLTRTLRELNGLLGQRQTTGERVCDCVDIPEDIDAFRIMLAQRIENFVRSHTGKTDGDAEPQAAQADAPPQEG
jgi:hypothetical protein